MPAQMAQRAAQRSSHCLLPVCPSAATVCSRGAGGTTTTTTAPTGSQHKLPTLEDLPRVTPWKMLYNLVFRGYLNRMHELQVYEKQIYGPIYRGGLKSIQLCSAELVEEVLRKEGKFPSRGDMSLWTEFRDMNGLGYGPFTEEGEKWYNLRTMLNKRMLHPKDSLQYGEVINEVVTDLIKRICHLRQASPTGDLVTNLSNELYRFSLEGISSILFESRLGCLEQEIPAGTQDFIDSIANMFTNSTAVMVSPKWTRSLLPFWGRYLDAWAGIFKFAGQLVDKKIEAIEQRVLKNQVVEGEYLTYLLSNTRLSHKEVHSSVTELLLAGVDTTSNTMMWTMYLLSTYPDVQDTLYEEVSKRVPGDQIPSAQDVTQMPYLKAVIKEVLRMYPVVPMNGRVITENDVVVGGYYFPKKTTFTLAHYAISHDETVFPEPWRFRPERWLRDGRPRPNGFASIPFGFGVRGCVGRRIAELEMYLALARIIKLFEIKPDLTMGEVKCHNRIVLVADRQVNFHFLDRGVQTSV